MTAKEYLKTVRIEDRILNREDLPEYWKNISTLMEEYKALSQHDVSVSVCNHLHQKWEGEYPHNCKKVCQVCREVLAN